MSEFRQLLFSHHLAATPLSGHRCDITSCHTPRTVSGARAPFFRGCASAIHICNQPLWLCRARAASTLVSRLFCPVSMCMCSDLPCKNACVPVAASPKVGSETGLCGGACVFSLRCSRNPLCLSTMRCIVGAGGKAGNGGDVKQQSATNQTGDHNSGKAVRLRVLLVLPCDGSNAWHGDEKAGAGSQDVASVAVSCLQPTQRRP